MDNEVIYYICDYKRNKECEKSLCQKYCFLTQKSKYSQDGKKYRWNSKNGELEEVDDRR